jgi:uncharacterized protein (DUF362 family)
MARTYGRYVLLLTAVFAGCRDEVAAPDAAPTASPSPQASASAAGLLPTSSAWPATSSPEADTVTHASPAASGSAGPPPPSVVVGNAIDGAALRKRHVEHLKSDHSPVTVLRGGGPLELGKRICEAVMPWKPKETPILLKPNICGFDGIKDPAKWKGDDGIVGRITDPEFTRGVVQCLKARGHTRVTIAEGCGHSHAFWRQVAFVSGYEAMAREEGVPLVAMDDDGVFDVEGEQPGKPVRIEGIGGTRVPGLLLPKVLAEHLDRGVFVSLPKVKAHRFSVVSLGIKGMQGTVMRNDGGPAYKLKFKMHQELTDYLALRKANKEAGLTDAPTIAAERKLYVDSLRAFAERMIDVLEVSMPDVVLADGAPGMGGDGFQALWPTAEMFAVGGTNAVTVDKVGSQLLGLWEVAKLGPELGGHKGSPLIELAARRYKLDLGAVKTTGDGVALLAGPRPTHFKSMAPFAIHSDGAPQWAPQSRATSIVPPAAPSTRAGPAAAAPAPSAAPSGAKREAHAVALGETRLTIDGRAEDAWQKAPAISFDTDYADKPSGISTQVRFAWSKEALHALFELEGAGLATDRTRPVGVEREALYQEDCVEIFLGPDPATPKRYYEIELGPFGHFFDLEVNAGKPTIAWSSGARIATTQDAAKRRAVIEVSLAAADVTRLLVPGSRWPLGIYRIEGKGERKYLAWSPPRTSKPNFHVPEAFGVLVVDP